MCGVSGIFEYGSGRAVDEGVLRAMTDSIAHRGPDDEGHFRSGPIGLGMRRLSIIDVEGGHQPMTNENSDVVVIFNGEIYNYVDLHRQLVDRGHSLATVSDTEVIPHLYEEYGLDFVKHLRGMFAVAIWDSRNQTLVVARDRLGIKPLYFVDNGTRLLFASEIKALFQDEAVPSRLDLEALSLYLSFKYVPAPLTMFEGIQSLPPGCMLVCDERGSEVRRYWDVPMDPPSSAGDLDEYEGEFTNLLRETVGLHMQSDVAFGAFLSGGLDSSLVATLMNEVMDQPVKTFSIGFSHDGQAMGELHYARLMADFLGSDHHEIVMDGNDFVQHAERAVYHLDQPIADAATIATLLLSDLTSQSVKMVMSGEGGDELFAGYGRYVGERFAPLLRPLPEGVRRRLVLGARDRVSHSKARVGMQALARRDFVDRLVNWFPLFDDDAKTGVMSSELKMASADVSPQAVLSEALRDFEAADRLSAMLYCDIKYWLPDLLLMRGDKMSMASSIELRVPLLDHHVVEFAGGLPQSLKIRGLTRKVMLRRVGEKLLPREIVDRKKEGFPLPLNKWWRGEGRELLEDTLAPSVLRNRGLLNPDAVARLIQEHDEGLNHGLRIWGLVSLELWLQQYIDRRPVCDGGVSSGRGQPGGLARDGSRSRPS